MRLDVVKKNLSKRNGDSHIDIQKREKEGSLVIIDGIKAHFNTELDVVSFITRLVKYAENIGKNSVSIFVDMSSFYHFGRMDELVEHELSLPSTYYNRRMKRFCVYHEKDFGRLREEHKQTLLKHHDREVTILDAN